MSDLPASIHTVVVGGGHSGLIMSRLLRQAGREHVILERRDTLGGGWQDRWDAFQLVTPNFLTDLPDFPYDGGDPDGYMTRDEIAARTAAYAGAIQAPVVTGTTVDRLRVDGDASSRFRIDTSRGSMLADEVVVATGAFHRPRIPATARFGPRIRQLHAHDYRTPEALPDGGVLVVGTGQTGVQLAEELDAAGRKVVLSVGHCWRAPRRYRGHDYFWWVRELVHHGEAVGTPLPSADTLPDPRMKLACNPHLSGHGGGHETNLRQFAANGMRLVGRFQAGEGEIARFGADLAENLRYADTFFDQRFRPLFDSYAEQAGLEVPPDNSGTVDLEVPEVTELDLAAEGISTVLFTTGYAPDYAWLDLPVIDDLGLPRHVRGVTDVPGLTFIGLLWQRNNASANLAGVASDADYLASRWS